jgi:hypothetical protein
LEDEEEDVSSYWTTLKSKKIMEVERESTTSQCVENSFLK